MGAQSSTKLLERADSTDKPPFNFDAAAMPILTQHWFGLRPAGTAYPRKRAHCPRPLGPGELARTRELRKRGLHLRLVEAWRP